MGLYVLFLIGDWIGANVNKRSMVGDRGAQGLGKSQGDVNYTLCSCVCFEDHSDSPLGAAVTLAHELGHNFGMNHDTLERGCGCSVAADKGGCIMNPSTGQVPTFQPLSELPQVELLVGKLLSNSLPGFLTRPPIETSRRSLSN